MCLESGSDEMRRQMKELNVTEKKTAAKQLQAQALQDEVFLIEELIKGNA